MIILWIYTMQKVDIKILTENKKYDILKKRLEKWGVYLDK